MGQFKDLTGQKFKRLTVLYRAKNRIDKNGRQFVMWTCQCDCGNIITIKGDALKSGNTGSCGCLHRDRTINYNISTKTKYNKYNLSNEYGIGYTEQGKKFIFDKEDYDLIKDYCWCIDTEGYVITNIKNHNVEKYNIKLHRLVMGCQKYDGSYVDHINHDKTDNRKINLRKVTNQQNCRNRSLQWNNTSGVSGVNFSEEIGKWIARIYDKGNSIYLGSFSNFDEAVRARKKAEEKYYQQYSYDNSMKQSEKYEI